MTRGLHSWTFQNVQKFLKENGFSVHKVRGSHFQFKKVSKERNFLVTVAFHGSKSIPIGTMNSIVRQSGIEKDKWTESQG